MQLPRSELSCKPRPCEPSCAFPRSGDQGAQQGGTQLKGAGPEPRPLCPDTPLHGQAAAFREGCGDLTVSSPCCKLLLPQGKPPWQRGLCPVGSPFCSRLLLKFPLGEDF